MMYQKDKRFDMPTSVDQAADLLVSDLMTGHMDVLRRLDDAQFEKLYDSVAGYILDDFRLWAGNTELLASCMEDEASGEDPFPDPARVILEKVRSRLQEELGTVIIT